MGLLNDYFIMFKSKGFKLVVLFFFEVHLYDLIYGLDTSLSKKSDNNLIPYMASWTSTNKKAFQFIRKVEKDYKDFAFIDIGVGKGKTVHMATKHLKNMQMYFGIDNDTENLATCRANLRNIRNIKIIQYDAMNFRLFNLRYKKFIVYLYNPFKPDIFISFLENNYQLIKYLILINNNYSSEIIKMHLFNLEFETSGWHVNQKITIFSRD